MNLRQAILSCSQSEWLLKKLPGHPNVPTDINDFKQSYFERLMTYFECENGALDHEVEFDRATAKIVVDPNRQRGR